MPTNIEITSFGYGHAEPPTAHITFDLREHFRDPHINPGLRELTANDGPVRAAVGIWDLVDATVAAVRAYLAAPGNTPIRVAVGCVGGRHRSAAVADFVAGLLRTEGAAVTLTHRDLHRPVIRRDGA